MKNFKQRWQISSNFQVFIILIVFAITGSSSMIVGDFVLDFFKISKHNFIFIGYYAKKIIGVFFIYQILLLTFGLLFGQIKFFWQFEKKMLSSLGFGFLFR